MTQVDADAQTRSVLVGAGVVLVKIGWPLFVRLLHRIFFELGREYARLRVRRDTR